ncbi:uncharacterized protein [Aegilops tauschii subsp. strangulata]|uniref:uncharacterized protein n=1 Tax=Aegilops tauschii subsp. strangulata TaxID=200361 RepID=UPI003CC8B861
MASFRDCLQVCELEDLGFCGIPFTYNNGQALDRNVQVRLDRACVDEAWHDLFPAARVLHLATSCSDHSPLLVQMEGVQEKRRRATLMRYEIMWERDPTLPDMVARSWNEHRPIGNLDSVANSLKEMMKDLKQWSKTHFGNVIKDIKSLRSQLAELQLSGADSARSKMNQLDELLYREEMLWLQCSRIAWLKEETEISDALFQIGPLKAPGCDGFPARFYQRNWATLKVDIVAAVQDFFITGSMPDGVNDTAIVLIPKVPHPKELKDFRPISLCNMVYKVAKNNSPALCAYKLDLSKAYDRVDWEFLEKALAKWGFSQIWISRVMASDALSSLIKKATREDDLQGVKISRSAPEISHLLFADDSLLFFHATEQQATLVKAYRFIFHCNNSLETELRALMQGMALAIQHSDLPVVVQSDSLEALSSLSNNALCKSAYGHLVLEIKDLKKAQISTLKSLNPQKNPGRTVNFESNLH